MEPDMRWGHRSQSYRGADGSMLFFISLLVLVVVTATNANSQHIQTSCSDARVEQAPQTIPSKGRHPIFLEWSQLPIQEQRILSQTRTLTGASGARLYSAFTDPSNAFQGVLANFLNQTAALREVEVDTSADTSGFIKCVFDFRQDRIFADVTHQPVPNLSFRVFVNSNAGRPYIPSRKIFQLAHAKGTGGRLEDYGNGFRRNRSMGSQQISFNEQYDRADIDIDVFNPMDIVYFVPHLFIEVLQHGAAKTPVVGNLLESETNPYTIYDVLTKRRPYIGDMSYELVKATP